jgi:sulfur-oxidizing protein SoxA
LLRPQADAATAASETAGMLPKFILIAICAAGAALVVAQTPDVDPSRGREDEIAKNRRLLEEDNPAELWEIRGEGLWKAKRGPHQASLERCDLGLGPGVVKGAYAQLPRYFPDTDKVQDLESRLVTCMVVLQGYTRVQATRDPFAAPGRQSDMEALAAYIAGLSKGFKINISLAQPKEQEAYRLGEEIFYYRAGPHDFGCVTCHGESNKRIRLQAIPNLLHAPDAQHAYTSWPAYRIGQGEVRTMQHRLWDCFRQQRFPEVDYASDTITALTLFLAKNANGGTMTAPGVKL